MVIGGPARCGKTTLSTRIAAADPTCFVLGVDALFRAILRKGIVNRVRPVDATVRHFLSRKRFQDAARSIAESPLDYTDLDLETLSRAGVREKGDHALEAYARTLDAMTAAAGKSGWATFDLHPEFSYGVLRRHIPGLKLVAMFRDPGEAIAAALYWRHQEGTPGHRRRAFRRAFLLWAMAVVATRKHQKRWPDDVEVLTLPRLLASDQPVSLFGIAALSGDASDISRDDLHFRREGAGFILPDGRSASLLSERERAEIAALLAPLAREVGLPDLEPAPHAHAGLGLRLYFGVLMKIARHQPQRAASLMDFIEAPIGVIRRHFALMREAARAFRQTEKRTQGLPS